jgi:hypothetical protein
MDSCALVTLAHMGHTWSRASPEGRSNELSCAAVGQGCAYVVGRSSRRRRVLPMCPRTDGRSTTARARQPMPAAERDTPLRHRLGDWASGERVHVSGFTVRSTRVADAKIRGDLYKLSSERRSRRAIFAHHGAPRRRRRVADLRQQNETCPPGHAWDRARLQDRFEGRGVSSAFVEVRGRLEYLHPRTSAQILHLTIPVLATTRQPVVSPVGPKLTARTGRHAMFASMSAVRAAAS